VGGVDRAGLTYPWTGLDYVVETLLDRLDTQHVLLWAVTGDRAHLIGDRGVPHADRVVDLALTDLELANGLFDTKPLVLRTPTEDAPTAVVAVLSHLPRRDLQRLLDEAAAALSIPRLLDRVRRREALVDGVLEAISDQAAVLDGAGVVLQANSAWTQTPGDHRAVVERSPIGSDYPAALRSQQSRPAGIAADGILAVLTGALPGFQSDYDAGERAYSLQVDPLPTGGAVVRHVDISFRKHLQRQLAHRATHDSLTGLPNRMVMVDRLGQALIRAARTASGVALLFCDVDRFKQINDTQGHGVGDQVLAAVGRRLQDSVRQSDVVARFGGDEFVVLLEDIDSEDAATGFARELQTAATHPIVVDGRPLYFGLSVGVALHPGTLNPDPGTIDTLLGDADAAMYAAKQAGRGSIRLFEPGQREAKRDPAAIAPALRTAALNDEIRMMVQPIVDLGSGEVTAYESLVRWDLPEVGVLSPADFLQTAEETGAIVDIGHSILRQTLAFASTVPATTGVSVNVSWTEVADTGFAEAVLDALRTSGVDPARLDLEVQLPASVETETLARLHAVRAAGVGVTLDAFGRQPVELAMLPRMPATTVKIDRTLTAYAAKPGPAARMLRGVVDLAGQLGLECVAEGVETQEQAAAAARLGFRRGQGFYFGKPVDPPTISPPPGP
jgi:diguanylate cyclase (GGDEF)-like protein